MNWVDGSVSSARAQDHHRDFALGLPGAIIAALLPTQVTSKRRGAVRGMCQWIWRVVGFSRASGGPSSGVFRHEAHRLGCLRFMAAKLQMSPNQLS
jgi:hypothetical protein